MKDKRSFFEKLTGAVRVSDEDTEDVAPVAPIKTPSAGNAWFEEEPEEGELSVDVYDTPTEIVIKTMVAGVKPEDLDISISRDTVTIKGKRETEKMIEEDDYIHKELYWGSFSRTITLPSEIEVEEAEAVEKHGLLVVHLPKIDKHKQTRLKVRS